MTDQSEPEPLPPPTPGQRLPPPADLPPGTRPTESGSGPDAALPPAGTPGRTWGRRRRTSPSGKVLAGVGGALVVLVAVVAVAAGRGGGDDDDCMIDLLRHLRAGEETGPI